MMRFVAAGSMRLARQRDVATNLSLRALSAAATTPGGGNPRQPSPAGGGLPRPNFTGSPNPKNNGPRPSQPPQRAPSQPPVGQAGGAAGKVIFDISAQDFKQVVLDSPVPVILDCWAEWCG